jgi:tetratricopeptide (TPR) repeat protein
LEISENQSGTNVPASVRLAIVQLKLGKVDEAKRNYQQAVSSLQKRMDDPRSAGPAHSSLMQLVRAFIDAKDLSDADECWRSAFTLKMDWGLNQTYLNDLLDAYLARKKYDQGIDLLNFVIEIATPEPGQEANSVSARRQLAGLTLVASTDASLGTRRGEMKTLSEKEFTELVRMCDTKDKPSLQFWKMQKDQAVQERIDELRQLGLENDAQKLERKFVTR